MECTDFLHAVTNSGKLKVILCFLGGHGQKWVWLLYETLKSVVS